MKTFKILKSDPAVEGSGHLNPSMAYYSIKRFDQAMAHAQKALTLGIPQAQKLITALKQIRQ